MHLCTIQKQIPNDVYCHRLADKKNAAHEATVAKSYVADSKGALLVKQYNKH
jgi:hypothetical protein